MVLSVQSQRDWGTLVATYGYRIHTMQPQLQRSRRFLKIEDVSSAAEANDACEQFYADVMALKAAGTQFGTPAFFVSRQEDEARQARLDDAENLPYFTILNTSRTDRSITVTIETGREADHDGLRSRDGTLETMSRRAAVRTSTVIYVFPVEGDYALMLSEVRGRTFVGESLTHWITRRAQRDAVQVDEDDNKSEGPWLNWKLEPRIDGERLDGILNNSADHSLKLRRSTVGSGGTRSTYDIELVQFGLKQTTTERFLEVLMAMSHRIGHGTEAERRAAAASDVLSLVEPDVGGVEFTDGELSFSENGKKQVITSETVDQLFIYPVGTKRLKEEGLRSHSEEVVSRIASMLAIQL